MLVLIKSSPDTDEGRRGLKMARDLSADIVFLQDGVYFALSEMIDGFCGTAYATEEDLALRGLRDRVNGVKVVGWEELVDMMADEEKVIGAI
ncbi:DsrH like protein [bacterium BMS3Bbin06]|nr:DsrH like protein [bacterium BMS3Abin08]GBE35216.1 DsrH like protein [bacterium BMS3Bbin06]HDO36043.1 hypothetical protein [Nitrospirota bacterium]HDY70655.1 hypothetical protein [Nitrospirota bacterium]